MRRRSRSGLSSEVRPSRLSAARGTEAVPDDRPSRVVARRARSTPPPAPRAVGLAVPDAARVLRTFVELSHELSLLMREEELVYLFVRAFRDLFPRRLFAVRLFDPDRRELSLVYATGRLRSDTRDEIALPRKVIAEHGIDGERLQKLPLSIVEDYRPIFAQASVGFAIPLIDPQRMFGVANVEYPPPIEPPEGDREMIEPFAMHMASALANAQLLRESVYLRDYLGKLIEEVNAPIAVVGPDRVVRVVNKAMERLTDRSREEVLGRDFVSVLPEAERARLVPHVLCALEGRATGEIEIKLPRKGGRYARATFSTTPILSSDHEVEGVIAIGRDLTELHALQEQVIQSEKLATLGQLAAGVVHELNNPLTSIRAYSEHLIRKFERSAKATGDGGDDVEKLRRIMEGADRIQRFTSDLTSYAHPATEEPALLSINEVIDQSLVFCEHVIRDAGVEVQREYGGNLAPIRGIKAQLHQVFINLVTNACHACENRHGRIGIRTIDAGTDRLRVVLTDNGVGIAEEQIVAIFEPFYSTKKDGKGTGLGLSIVRRILDSHGATIRVFSALGEGSTFEVTLHACTSRPADPG